MQARGPFARLLPLAWIASALLAGPASAEPWRLDRAIGAHERLSFTIEQRTRYELHANPFRQPAGGGNDLDQVLAFRTLFDAQLRITDHLMLGAELIDSRIALEDANTPVNTTEVNPVELLRAYLRLSLPDVIGGKLQVDAGRLTIDVGSRRLVARNRYRNTINAFTGVDARWRQQARELRAFVLLPIQRLPSDPASLRDADVEFDEESFDVVFWGLFFGDRLSWGDQLELFWFGLHERDSADRPTRNRRLQTPGFRLYREPAAGHFDYVIEMALQFGESRADNGDTEDLDHFAHFHHLEAGYRFDAAWAPRVALQYDYASGDDDPNDGDNQRFETLFGARRFDFGPTGIYGPFSRSNLHTPGLRVQVKPCERVTAFAAYRLYWLASRKDTWTADIRDPSGGSGSFLGSQLEFRIRWELIPGNVRLETGLAQFFSEGFAEDAPRASSEGDSTYFYTQAVFRF